REPRPRPWFSSHRHFEDKESSMSIRLFNSASLIASAALLLAQTHDGHENAAPAKLVQLVRDATRQFINVNAATAAGYQPFLGCVSGPDHGAMGYHYVNGTLVGD